MLPVEKGRFGALQTGANNWSNKLTQAVAACNGLILVNKTTVGGDELETALFKAVEARFVVSWQCRSRWLQQLQLALT